jgi:hypothetical protein
MRRRDSNAVRNEALEEAAYCADFMVQWVREQPFLGDKTARIETAEQIAIAIRNKARNLRNLPAKCDEP